MRGWMIVITLAAGCAPSCNFDLQEDPCPGHGVRLGAGLFVYSDCSCPLASQIGPQLEGQTCDQEGLACTPESYSEKQCTCTAKKWRCAGSPDLSVAHERIEDLSVAPEERD